MFQDYYLVSCLPFEGVVWGRGFSLLVMVKRGGGILLSILFH